MNFFFVKDYKNKYKYFSSEPLSEIKADFTRWKELWELAKKKLMLLPHRILMQEQTFERTMKLKEKKITILYSGYTSDKKIRIRFFLFLQKQRTKHILYLIGETFLLPFSGLAAFLPGPNVFFGVLALLMITHWQAFRGINRTSKKEYHFIPVSSLKDWERAIESKNEDKFSYILKNLEKEYRLDNIQKILWK